MIVVEGTIRIPPGTLERARPHMKAMAEATRREPGCLAYSYAPDLFEEGLIWVIERWENEDGLRAHTATDHFKAWRAASAEIGVSDRDLRIHHAEPVML